MKITLNVECNFNEIFNDVEGVWGTVIKQPKSKVGHIRAYHDGYRWNTTYFPCHEELKTKEIRDEFNNVFESIIENKIFKDIKAISKFCHEHPLAAVNNTCSDEYNFFTECKLCNYWVRFITRHGDYNIYLHAFVKS